MMQVYIWGAGYYARQVIDEIDNTKVHIAAILDNDEKKQGSDLFGSVPVVSPLMIVGKEFDYLVISVKNYAPIEQECGKMGIAPEKVISYWKDQSDAPVFIKRGERVEMLMQMVAQEKKLWQYRLDSAPYEWGIKKSPNILSAEELLRKILNDRSSLCRFGDGEFEIIRGNERPWFQQPDRTLGERLKEVLFSEDEAINIAIPQNFVGLERYREGAADSIRQYMFGDTRDAILGLLDNGRAYYDAYVSRPYIIYKDKRNADEIFTLFKEIWKGRDVTIVEGEYSRIGAQNDLMKNARSISRILCPSKNAWDKYQEILDAVLKLVSKSSLICLSLGPCATVLAYDLAKQGYQALDIGQIDDEYEWYLRNAEKQIAIPGKMVAEFWGKQELEMADRTEYEKQVIAKIA